MCFIVPLRSAKRRFRFRFATGAGWAPARRAPAEDINQILELPLHAGNIPGQEELTQDTLPGSPHSEKLGIGSDRFLKEN